MTAAELQSAVDLALAEMGEAGALGNMQREVEARDHPDGVDLRVRFLFSWDSRLPVVMVQLGGTFRAEADPETVATEMVRSMAELALATVPAAKRWRRRLRGAVVE